MLAACCAVLVSGVGFVLLLLNVFAEFGGCPVDGSEVFSDFVVASIADVLDVVADCAQQVSLIERVESDGLIDQLGGDACSADGDSGAIVEVVARGLFDFHCVVCCVLAESGCVPLLLHILQHRPLM